MAAKKTTKGKRYSDSEKEKIVAFANQVNAEKGRGGPAAAVKKFGVSAITVASWMAGSSKEPPTPSGARGSREKVLVRLGALDREIATKRKELTKLEAEFEKLKAQL